MAAVTSKQPRRNAAASLPWKPIRFQALCHPPEGLARQAGLEPTTLGLEGGGANPPTVSRLSQTPVTTEAPAGGAFQPPHPSPGSTKVFAASLLQGAASGPGARLLTVREVAARLSVCTATVYSLCSRGLLHFIRVSGALRIDPASVEAFITAGGARPGQN